MVKYRVHEVAKDFKLTTKTVSTILKEYATAPKNHMQALSDQELNIVFDYLTINNQVDSIEKIFELPANSAESTKNANFTEKSDNLQNNSPLPPRNPTQPATPTQSSAPIQPAAPAQSTAPTQPAAPAQSTAPTQPAAPAQSTAPTQPVAPVQSSAPAQPPTPAQPMAPTQSAAPANQPQHTPRTAAPNRTPAPPAQPQQPRQYSQHQNRHQQPHHRTPAQQSNTRPAPNRTAPPQPNQSARSAPQAPPHSASAAQPAHPPQTSKVPQKKIIDTRGATVNIAKYDERLDQFVPDKLANAKQGKVKFAKRGQDRHSAAAGAKKRQEQRAHLQKLQLEIAKKQPLKVTIPDEIGVGELASRMKKTGTEVVKQLIKLGTMASLSDIIDYETAALVAMELGCKVEREIVMTIEERLIDDSDDDDAALVPRSPVVVVMGHVDHGKTSLLDRIRNAKVAEGEAGGITQHIGAYQVETGGKYITFLDTPGHEAFTSMRARGAMITDIAILVVAADDGIMPQTIEAINHAKAADIPIVVAINKMDKDGANPERIKQQLTEHGLLSDEWGGDTIICPISAKTGHGVDSLLEMVAFTAEMRELRANPNRRARGTVIEAKLDKGRGPVATLLIQNGTLNQGDVIIAGTAVGRVRTMINDKGERVNTAGPSVPIEITGLSEAPGAGDVFNAVEDERMARELVDQRKHQHKQTTTGSVRKVSLDDLFSQIQQGEIKELAVIVKADVQGSAEAVKASLEKLSNPEVRVRVIHSGVGAINESDIMLASTSSAIVVGFNVRPDAAARDSALRAAVDMRMYRVIYECIDEIEAAMKGMLAPKFKESLLGHAEVRQLYKASKIGTIAGCYVQDGKLARNAEVRIVRDGIVVHEGTIASLKRFKDDVREVASGYECGVSLENFNDIKESDIIEAFIMEQIQL